MTVLMEVKNLKTEFHTEEGTVYAVNGISYTLNEG
ncbi:MAG: ABC transporter ATP-binding protein, partial [Chloroflexi bacterium]|nr:ABC transporter ATP-binding protein [Chloroflexota bacterium]